MSRQSYVDLSIVLFSLRAVAGIDKQYADESSHEENKSCGRGKTTRAWNERKR